jgi:hypothetical protein
MKNQILSPYWKARQESDCQLQYNDELEFEKEKTRNYKKPQND